MPSCNEADRDTYPARKGAHFDVVLCDEES
jgi:hypothetical protein